jgi:hypothetical protein
MKCNAERGEREAAREALAVSERSLQRVKQKGCDVATRSDRRVFQVPDYKALPWPIVSGPDITLEHAPNNMDLGRASVNAAEFAEPFVNTSAGSTRVLTKPALGAPGTDFAGSSDLIATEEASFVSSELPKPAAYQQLASAVRMDFAGVIPPGSVTAPAALAQSRLGTTLGTLEPEAPAAAPLGRNASVYGAAASDERRVETFVQKLTRSGKGALYDALHYADIDGSHMNAGGYTDRVSYIIFRDGRCPYLVFILFAFLLVIFATIWITKR